MGSNLSVLDQNVGKIDIENICLVMEKLEHTTTAVNNTLENRVDALDSVLLSLRELYEKMKELEMLANKINTIGSSDEDC